MILVTQQSMSKEEFSAWGWRIPFLISIFLVAISLYIRLKLKESPIFASMKSAGRTSLQPLKDAFTKWPNLKQVLITLFGATAGQGVVWYTGQFYALFYMQTVLKINPDDGKQDYRGGAALSRCRSSWCSARFQTRSGERKS